MDFGILPRDLAEIIQALQEITAIEEAVIFGSRAKGNYKKGSDIDIAIKGLAIDREDVATLSSLLNDESSLPYFFDIVHYEEISEMKLVEHVDRVGQVIYLRENGAKA